MAFTDKSVLKNDNKILRCVSTSAIYDVSVQELRVNLRDAKVRESRTVFIFTFCPHRLQKFKILEDANILKEWFRRECARFKTMLQPA